MYLVVCHTCVINLTVHEYITPIGLDYITNGYLAIATSYYFVASKKQTSSLSA